MAKRKKSDVAILDSPEKGKKETKKQFQERLVTAVTDLWEIYGNLFELPNFPDVLKSLGEDFLPEQVTDLVKDRARAILAMRASAAVEIKPQGVLQQTEKAVDTRDKKIVWTGPFPSDATDTLKTGAFWRSEPLSWGYLSVWRCESSIDAEERYFAVKLHLSGKEGKKPIERMLEGKDKRGILEVKHFKTLAAALYGAAKYHAEKLEMDFTSLLTTNEDMDERARQQGLDCFGLVEEETVLPFVPKEERKPKGKRGRPAKPVVEQKEDPKPTPKAGKGKNGTVSIPSVKPEKAKKSLDGGPSNKEVVYKMWKKKPSVDPEVCFKAVEERVKLSSVKSWIADWKKGNNLPACAKK